MAAPPCRPLDTLERALSTGALPSRAGADAADGLEASSGVRWMWTLPFTSRRLAALVRTAWPASVVYFSGGSVPC